ncbi:MAG TPA: hypothetical protein VHZ02_08830 [Acidimicrobiales bacterium]|nr:hypothetical protein [Acidimicrobiales bacterium]
MRRWLGLVVFAGAFAVALMIVVPHLDVTGGNGTGHAVVGTSVARTSGSPDVGVCLPGSRCDPASPPASSGVVLWQEAVILGLVVIAIVGISRTRRSKTRARLPRGVRAMVLRPPQAPLTSV